MSRYDLTDVEWGAIEPRLPNRPRGVARVHQPAANSKNGAAGVTRRPLCISRRCGDGFYSAAFTFSAVIGSERTRAPEAA